MGHFPRLVNQKLSESIVLTIILVLTIITILPLPAYVEEKEGNADEVRVGCRPGHLMTICHCKPYYYCDGARMQGGQCVVNRRTPGRTIKVRNCHVVIQRFIFILYNTLITPVVHYRPKRR